MKPVRGYLETGKGAERTQNQAKLYVSWILHRRILDQGSNLTRNSSTKRVAAGNSVEEHWHVLGLGKRQASLPHLVRSRWERFDNIFCNQNLQYQSVTVDDFVTPNAHRQRAPNPITAQPPRIIARGRKPRNTLKDSFQRVRRDRVWHLSK